MQKEYLVGYTGFVGSNLAAEHKFSYLFNSQNIQDAFGGEPDLLVYAGVPGVMFLANQYPEKDKEVIQGAIRNIEKISPKKIVLISTVQVYPAAKNVNEDSVIEEVHLSQYGANRYALERWVENNCRDRLIVRLPAIFGKNLRKNFLYDYIHFIPPMLTPGKLNDLSVREPMLLSAYQPKDDGYFHLRQLSEEETAAIKACFQRLGFSALNFTDSRSVYQFYDLKRLWGHIDLALEHNLTKLNIATPPIETGELYYLLTGRVFENHLTPPPFDYDFRSKHAELFGGANGYIMSRETELEDIKNFLRAHGAEVR